MIPGAVINGAIEWMRDNRTLIVHLVPANRSAAHQANAIPRALTFSRVWGTPGRRRLMKTF
jgi:hypothetical protein